MNILGRSAVGAAGFVLVTSLQVASALAPHEKGAPYVHCKPVNGSNAVARCQFVGNGKSYAVYLTAMDRAGANGHDGSVTFTSKINDQPTQKDLVVDHLPSGGGNTAPVEGVLIEAQKFARGQTYTIIVDGSKKQDNVNLSELDLALRYKAN